MKRREFMTLLGGSVAGWPLAARAQQPAMPVIGFLSALLQATTAPDTATVRLSLAEAGYVEGRNLGVEYRFAEGQYDRLPTMAGELLRRQVAVIVAMGTPAALAAKAATASLPIVFSATEDPVNLGLVASIARPGGNATGVSFQLSELAPKQLGLLRELLPAASRFGLLVNPKNENAETITRDLKAAAAKISVDISVVQASNSREIEAAFAVLVRDKVDALVIGTDPFFYSRRVHLTTLATRHALPAVYNLRGYAEAGGRLRDKHHRSLSPSWCLYRSHPERREAHRSAGSTIDQVRFHHQSADRPRARARRAAHVARPRRRGDRIRERNATLLAASAHGS